MGSKRSSFRSIGKKIQKARREQKLSANEVSKKLRINAQFLKNIEAGDVTFLPAPYVRAFVKNYADFLKLDGQTILDEWPQPEAEPEVDADQKPETGKKDPAAEKLAPKNHPEIEHKIRSARTYRKEIIVGACLALIISVIIFFSTWSNDQVTAPAVKNTNTNKNKEIPFEEVLQEVNKKQEDAGLLTQEEPQTPAEVLNLRLQASDSVWVRVVIDDIDESEAIFAPGDVRSFQAVKEYQLQIGNAAGIKLFLNGKELGPVGRAGQVRHIRIDAAGIHPYRRAVKISPKDSVNKTATVENDSTAEN